METEGLIKINLTFIVLILVKFSLILNEYK
ncbi:hypothetical protein NBC122_00152 [Chryseobacterium salivictor]|uniref:Uncharacterized protein n=1 Tax=Chryseobacterium salivictor TaxID=2547600 RepID=A0A4P6ZC02_9FLAO|nr:hypothetical protein NBC122_00152 [Chryseobacterium salivictor]